MGIDANFRLAGRGRDRLELFRWFNADDFESTEPTEGTKTDRSFLDRLSTHRLDGELIEFLGDCYSYPDHRDH